MSRLAILLVAILATFMAKVDAECSNACNGHGKCVGYDMCICNRNWQANDCSERVCMHGLAHVDTPKGDLDMSGEVIQPGTKVVVDNSFQYPYGTTEQFPQMEDTDLAELTDSAHYYMECSNKGTCDRSSGMCECFDGYDGVACQRASCPGYPASCSGHGVCKTASQLAASDNGNIYKLWNKDATMGCECDSGYFGADCSERDCKVGVDPLYLDDSSTVKYSIFDFATLTTADSSKITHLFDDGHPQRGSGYWAIRFFDHSGEDWVTGPIKAGSTCDEVSTALYSIPNNVIPAGTLYCTMTSKTGKDDNSMGAASASGWNSGYDAQHGVNEYKINYRMAIWDAYIYTNSSLNSQGDPLSKVTENGNLVYSPLMWFPGSFTSNDGLTGNTIDGPERATLSGHIYRIKFFGNPGQLRSPEIVTHLDGKRNSLKSTLFTGVSTVPTHTGAVITKVWTDGQQGEDKDYFADHCDGVTVTIDTDAIASAGVADMSNNEATKYFRLATANSDQTALLKKCLGDSDATSTNNVEIYDWDYGSHDYPHLVKLVRTVTAYTDGGYYVALTFTGGYFEMLNPFVPPDAALSDTYEVYTTKGTLSRVSRRAEAHFGFGSKKVFTTHTETASQGAHWDGDLSCEVGANNGFRTTKSTYAATATSTSQESGAGMKVLASGTISSNGDGEDVYINDVVTEWSYDYATTKRTAEKHYKNCLNKTDIITFLNIESAPFNPTNLNLYTIDRLVKDKSTWSNFKHFGATEDGGAGSMSEVTGSANTYDRARGMEYGTNVITLDLATNWGTDLGTSALHTHVSANTVSSTFVYKFVPHADSTYEYVAECSNRGVCDREAGVCGCFPGYTNDNCDTQSSLAL